MSELTNFLKSQQAAGQIESQGRFTLALAKARTKLQKYQLENPSYYILKMVQAANALGATEMRIAIDYESTRLGMLMPAAPSVHELVEALQLPPQGGALRHLALSLNAGLGTALEELEWTVQGAERSHRLRVVGETAQLSSGDGNPELGENWLCQLVLTRLSGVGLKSAAQTRAVADEYLALVRRCRFSPLEFWVDGRSVWEPWSPSSGTVDYLATRYVLAGYGQSHFMVDAPPWSELDWREEELHGRWVGPPGLFFKRSAFADKVPSWLVQVSRPISPDVARLPCRGALRFARQLEGPTLLWLIMDGVLLPPIELRIGLPGLEALAVWDGLKVDLSEFGVIRDEAFADLVAWLKEEALGLFRHLCAHHHMIHRVAEGGNTPSYLTAWEQVKLRNALAAVAAPFEIEVGRELPGGA
ncbi:MAG: hypothetical protein KC910_20260 [Candidatus Eremiobacteraeota bacterium]|nr:hypothetical protein [Candidatus Eremiobacteraeota bacterium]